MKRTGQQPMRTGKLVSSRHPNLKLRKYLLKVYFQLHFEFDIEFRLSLTCHVTVIDTEIRSTERPWNFSDESHLSSILLVKGSSCLPPELIMSILYAKYLNSNMYLGNWPYFFRPR